MKTRYILIFLVIITGFQAYSQESKLLTKTSDLTFCIDSSELKIGLLRIGLKMSDVVEIIGQADSIKIDSSLFISNLIHYYKGLIIYYLDDRVFGILANSDKYTTPGGIHTGLSRDKVFEILGLEQNEILLSEHEIEFSACHNDDYVIQLIFDNSLILRGIVVAIDLM